MVSPTMHWLWPTTYWDNSSEIASSDGVIVDITPPLFLLPVCDGAVFKHDLDYSSNSTSLSINWKCEDKESGLRQVLVALGTQPGIQDVIAYRSVLPYQTSHHFNGVNLTTGLKYFSTVRCVNSVGQQKSISSDGIMIDFTPPMKRYINIGDKPL